MSFANKAVLVTGGTGGIGRAVVEAFLVRGARVAVGGRDRAAFDRLAADQDPERIFPALGDIASLEGCRATAEAALAALGGLDVLVNAAGYYVEAPFAATDEALWATTIDVNLKGSYFATQAVLPALQASRGNVVNIASESGLIAYPDASAYCAAKGGVVNLTRALARELAPAVRVNCICPGNVDTEMIGRAAAASGDREGYLAMSHAHAPMGRMARPEEIVSAVLYFAADDAGFTTGAILAVDGGTLAG